MVWGFLFGVCGCFGGYFVFGFFGFVRVLFIWFWLIWICCFICGYRWYLVVFVCVALLFVY